MNPGDSDIDRQSPSDEREQFEHLAARLVSERPVPGAAFRGDLRRWIARAPVRRRLRRQAVASLSSGAALLAIAALGVNGIGPLSPHPLSEEITMAKVSGR